MALSRRQKLALTRSTAPINIWYGSIRSSKTFAQVTDFIARMSASQGEGVNIVIGFSTNTVWRNIFQPIFNRPEFEAIAPHLNYRRNAPEGTLFGKPFAVVGANNESSWLAIQGLTIENAWGDEAVGWPESFWEMLVSRLSLPSSRLLVTCNPGTSSHYLKKLMDSDDPDVHVEKFLLEQNPTLGVNYVNRLKRMYSGLFYRRMILAEWVAAEGAVYQGWDPSQMVAPHTLEYVTAIGIDYGTNHPTAAYAIGVGKSGHLEVGYEWSPNTERGSHRRLTDRQLADSLEIWLETLPSPPQFIYCDPAAASFREELKQRGIATTRADNSVLDGIRQVDSLFNAGQLTVDPSCKKLQEEIASYRWDPKATDKGNDAPIKEKDDHVDALRYAVRSSRHLWGRAIRPQYGAA